jgi:hypothetical protein
MEKIGFASEPEHPPGWIFRPANTGAQYPLAHISHEQKNSNIRNKTHSKKIFCGHQGLYRRRPPERDEKFRGARRRALDVRARLFSAHIVHPAFTGGHFDPEFFL